MSQISSAYSLSLVVHSSGRPDQYRVQGVGKEHLLRPLRAAWLRTLRADGGPRLNAPLPGSRGGARNNWAGWRARDQQAG